jgi:hypothetical protein
MRIRDPGWKNSDPGSSINIPDPHTVRYGTYECRAPPVWNRVSNLAEPQDVLATEVTIFTKALLSFPFFCFLSSIFLYDENWARKSATNFSYRSTHIGSVVDPELFVQVGSGSEMFVPDPDLDLDLNPDPTLLTITIANCSSKWSISSSIIYTFP